MSECLHLAERMPGVALGRDEWTELERQHLSGCSSCRREWELIRVAQGMGDGQLAPFDSRGTTRNLLQRLQRSRRQRRARRIWGLTGLGLAASLAAVFWSRPADQLPGSPAPLMALEIPLPELDELGPVELDSVLSGMEQPLAADSAAEAAELGDLDSEDLETVLDIWEG